MVTFEEWFSVMHANIPLASARAVLAPAEGGATLPFIARYRKEQTGNLDEVAIQSVLDAREAASAARRAPSKNDALKQLEQFRAALKKSQ